MSDMALVDWQRKAAREAGPAIRQPTWVRGLSLPAGFAGKKLAVGLAGVLVAGLCCLGLALMPSHEAPRAMPQLGPTAVAPPAWLDIIKPLQIYSLETSDLAQEPKTYRARRNHVGGGRMDTLAFGSLDGQDTALRLTLYRRGTEPYAAGPFFSDVARLAAEAGVSVTRSGLPDLMATRFGKVQVADFALNAMPASACQGFRLVLDAPALTMTGLACGGRAGAILSERLGCMLERLDLTSGADDKALVGFFAITELQRNAACAGMRLGPDTLPTPGLDGRSATPRKNARHRR